MTQFIIDLKSQTWRTEKDVDRPIWRHWLIIVKPDKPASKTAYRDTIGSRVQWSIRAFDD